MPYYLLEARYSAEAVKAMIANPQDRSGPAGQIIEALGGKLHDFFFAMGSSDVVAIIELPEGQGDVSMIAGSMVIGASGAVTDVTTRRLFTADEAVAAMKAASAAAGAYKPPKG